ncbi:MAG: CADD family putative folate metabolism protein [Janthinobacterium lividum]
MSHPSLIQIDRQVADRSVLAHPFYQAWQRGELTQAALADYAGQYYHHVAAFPQYLSALHSHTADAGTRRAVLQNLIDEEAGDPNHPELWLQFAEGIGSARADVLAAPATPETLVLVDTFQRLCRNGSVAAGLAALYSYESQIPEVAKTKIAGLETHYGIHDDETLAYFRVHQEADVEHAAVERGLLVRHLNDADSQDAGAASQQALDAVWNLLSGVCQRHAIVC